jgi:hypothetical protein
MFLPGLVYQDLYILSRLKRRATPSNDASLHTPSGSEDFDSDGDNE